MCKTLFALIWAAAILGIALLANDAGINGDSAATLLIVLPLLAVMQMSGRIGCGPCLQERHP